MKAFLLPLLIAEKKISPEKIISPPKGAGIDEGKTRTILLNAHKIHVHSYFVTPNYFIRLFYLLVICVAF